MLKYISKRNFLKTLFSYLVNAQKIFIFVHIRIHSARLYILTPTEQKNDVMQPLKLPTPISTHNSHIREKANAP